MKSILFVCTGNIFRSMTAEYALKAALGADPVYAVSSAGTEAVPQKMAPYTCERLQQRGLDPSRHQQRRVTVELLSKSDLVVAMGLDHRQHLRQQFERETWLFNQICFGREDPVLDIWEAVPNYQHDQDAKMAYGIAVVDYICDAMPHFMANVKRYL